MALLKKAAYFAIFAHAPQVATHVTSKYDAWGWAKRDTQMFMEAPSRASFGRRSVIGGMAGALGRNPIAMGRANYALHWPLLPRSEFISLRRELSARRMTVFG